MLSVDIDEWPIVLVRPFKGLFHCYDDLRSAVEKLEEKFLTKQESENSLSDDKGSPNDAHAEKLDSKGQEGHSPMVKDGFVHDLDSKQGPTAAQAHVEGLDGDLKDIASDGEDEDHEQSDDGDPDDPNTSEMALQHLKVLLEFMDSEILAKFTYLQTNECKNVFFPDLWYLFRPGQEVISRDGNQAYRVVHVSSPRHQNTQPWDLWRWYNSRDREDEEEEGPFQYDLCLHRF